MKRIGTPACGKYSGRLDEWTVRDLRPVAFSSGGAGSFERIFEVCRKVFLTFAI